MQDGGVRTAPGFKDWASHHTWVAGLNFAGESMPPVNVQNTESISAAQRLELEKVTPRMWFAGRMHSKPLVVASPKLKGSEKSKGSVNGGNMIAVAKEVLSLYGDHSMTHPILWLTDWLDARCIGEAGKKFMDWCRANRVGLVYEERVAGPLRPDAQPTFAMTHTNLMQSKIIMCGSGIPSCTKFMQAPDVELFGPMKSNMGQRKLKEALPVQGAGGGGRKTRNRIDQIRTAHLAMQQTWTRQRKADALRDSGMMPFTRVPLLLNPAARVGDALQREREKRQANLQKARLEAARRLLPLPEGVAAAPLAPATAPSAPATAPVAAAAAAAAAAPMPTPPTLSPASKTQMLRTLRAMGYGIQSPSASGLAHGVLPASPPLAGNVAVPGSALAAAPAAVDASPAAQSAAQRERILEEEFSDFLPCVVDGWDFSPLTQWYEADAGGLKALGKVRNQKLSAMPLWSRGNTNMTSDENLAIVQAAGHP